MFFFEKLAIGIYECVAVATLTAHSVSSFTTHLSLLALLLYPVTVVVVRLCLCNHHSALRERHASSLVAVLFDRGAPSSEATARVLRDSARMERPQGAPAHLCAMGEKGER